MMRKLVTIMFIALVMMFAIPSEAQYPMPACECVDLFYCPAGPDLPLEFSGVLGGYGVWPDAQGILVDVAVDVGNLPYSVPNYGWHCNMTGQMFSVGASIYAMTYAIEIRLWDLRCCGALVNPGDPIFTDGVVLEWDNEISAYAGTAGSSVYFAEVTVDAVQTTVNLYMGVYSSTGTLSIYARYIITPSSGPVFRNRATAETS
jgi:hypothetical protein